MYIYFECENGHRLKAREANEGRETHCPRCKAAVAVPQRRPKTVTDSSIVRLLTDDDMKTLNEAASLANGATAKGASANGDAQHKSKEEAKAATIDCPRCRETIPASSRSCERCGLYITVNAGAWSNVLQTAKRYVRDRRGA
jgi:Zn finger protein HypA/HybF involved in hydrogenase expression